MPKMRDVPTDTPCFILPASYDPGMETIKSEYVTTAVHPRVKERLRELASQEGRSLTRQVAWILERYVQAKEDDGA